MNYSLSSIMNSKITLDGESVKPLLKYRKLNNLDIMPLEDYLAAYNPNLNKFSIKQLVNKLEKNCTIFGPGKLSSGEPQVFGEYIYDVISTHYTQSKGHGKKEMVELDTDLTKIDNNREYLIYLAVDNRDISGYNNPSHLRVKYRRKKLQKRYTYANPLNRIHGFSVLDDEPCLCREAGKRYLSIKIICANPFAPSSKIKAVGSYLLMFIMMMAYVYKFNKLILEVTNSQAADILGEDEEDSEEEDSEEEDSEEEDSEEEEEEEDSEEEDSEEEEEEEDSEEDSEEEDEDDDRLCCHINISRNLKCNDDTDNYSDNYTKDKYDYEERVDELDQMFGKKDLIELCECYDIDYLKKHTKADLIYKIIQFEYWRLEESESLYEGETCDSSWITEGDEELGYHGEKYLKGRLETKRLYCNFYEKHGFRENPKLNTIEKCFTIDPLPSMEINMNENRIENLINVFFKRKYYQQVSKFCGHVSDDNILLK